MSQFLRCVLLFLLLTLPLFADNRSFTGEGNNLSNPDWGAAGTNFLRLAPHAFDSPTGLAGEDLMGPRQIANILFDQDALIPNEGELSGYVYAFGQFISHDLQRTESGDDSIAFEVPDDDPIFAAGSFPLTRSIFDPSTGRSRSNPRQQVNFTSAYLDGSHIYGTTEIDSLILRGGPINPSAKLRTSNEINGDGQDLLPRDKFGPSFTADFVAGDDRVNDNVVLTSIHAVFMREHNRLVDVLAERNPELNSEELFQKARRIVGGQLQAITYNEFLPALLGDAAPAPRGEYDPQVDASGNNEFATVFLRLGHSMLTPDFKRIRLDGTQIESVPLRDAFFNPAFLDTTRELELLLNGLSKETQENVDLKLVDGMRFAALGAIDLQRARDHGLADYNTMRHWYGLDRAETFADISSDVEVQQQLALAYEDVDSVEAFSGALAEDHLPGANVGPLTSAVYVEQFTRIRDGDRFWYSNDDDLTPDEIEEIEGTTLGDIITRNTLIRSLQENVFEVSSDVAFDCTKSGFLSANDLTCSNVLGTTDRILNRLGLLHGDLNGDRQVAFDDFLTLADNFGKPKGRYTDGDIDGSGDVGFLDFLTLAENFGRGSTSTTLPSLAAVPEPHSRMGFLLGMVFVCGVCRRVTEA